MSRGGRGRGRNIKFIGNHGREESRAIERERVREGNLINEIDIDFVVH